ncbi:unnamed protein product [Cylicocyclus nassatus]|uniref:Uncharacterized protein n=1 Tax=Cylicocyclus nassatus TaxID=53992 RepID=A0AA36HFE2_CYLNA|nr:unnamed protein product [Cylicocyclus nassatus]
MLLLPLLLASVACTATAELPQDQNLALELVKQLLNAGNGCSHHFKKQVGQKLDISGSTDNNDKKHHGTTIEHDNDHEKHENCPYMQILLLMNMCCNNQHDHHKHHDKQISGKSSTIGPVPTTVSTTPTRTKMSKIKGSETTTPCDCEPEDPTEPDPKVHTSPAIHTTPRTTSDKHTSPRIQIQFSEPTDSSTIPASSRTMPNRGMTSIPTYPRPTVRKPKPPTEDFPCRWICYNEFLCDKPCTPEQIVHKHRNPYVLFPFNIPQNQDIRRMSFPSIIE